MSICKESLRFTPAWRRAAARGGPSRASPGFSITLYRCYTYHTHVLPNTNTHPTTSNTPFTPCWLVWVADACWDVCIHCDVSSKAQFSDPAAGSELQLLSSRRNIPVNISIYMFQKYYLYVLFWFISFVHVITRTVCVWVCVRACACVCVRACVCGCVRVHVHYILLIVPVQFSTLWDSVESFICNVWSIFLFVLTSCQYRLGYTVEERN